MRPFKSRVYALLAIITAVLIFNSNVAAQEAGNGLLVGLAGPVELRPSRAEDFRAAAVQDTLSPGAVLKTGAAGRAKIFLPPELVLTLDEQSSLEWGAEASAAPGPERAVIKVLTGNLHFIAGKASAPAYLLQSSCFLIEPRDVEGILASQPGDRLFYLAGGSGLSVTNRVSRQSLQLRPGQMAIGAAKGRTDIAWFETRHAPQFQVDSKVGLLPPPPTVLQPSAPAPTPITLADQVKQPWPVFPPVLQDANPWIRERLPSGKYRPKPRP
ncbi:MAG: hypothetical protein ACLFUU_07765 [Desulfobacteraceae bacterium]